MYFSTVTIVAFLSATVVALPADTSNEVCQAICHTQEPTCGDFGYPKKEENSPCWTCCRNDKPVTPPNPNAICQAICYLQEPTCGGSGYAKKEENSPCWTCCTDQEPTTPTPPTPPTPTPNEFCLAICYLEKPDCGDAGTPRKEENSPCWTCCKEQGTPAPPSAPGCPAPAH